MQMVRQSLLLVSLVALFGLLLLGGVKLAGQRGGVRNQLEALVRDKWIPFPGYPTSGEAWGSSELFLADLALPQAVQTVSRFTQGLQSNEVLLIVGANEAPFYSQVAVTIMSLNWPHRMQMVRCSQSPELVHPSVAGEKIRRVLFYRMNPPAWAQRVRRIGPNLSLIDVSEETQWHLFCLQ